MYNSVQQVTTGYNRLQQVTTGYNNVQQCTTVYNSVQQCTTVYNSVQQFTTGYNSGKQWTTVYKSVQMCTHFLVVDHDLEMPYFKFQVSRMPGWSSKTPLSTISRVGYLEDKLFLTLFLVLDHDLEIPCFKFQVSRMSFRKVIKDTPIHHLYSWILGGQVVPDALSSGRSWPGDAIFQISSL